jgi:hypothetical protein
MPEVVIRRQGESFAFTLPDGHEFSVLDDVPNGRRPLARIGIPGARGETCAIVGIEARDGESEYVLEPVGVSSSVGNQPTGYAWPLIQDEHDRLRRRWVAAGGAETAFDAWGRHNTHDEQFREWRAEIRRMEAASS